MLMQPMPCLTLLRPDSVAIHAADIMPHFQKIADGSAGKWWPEDILQAVARGQIQCWVIMESEALFAVFLTRISFFPRRSVLECLACSGRGWKRWKHLLRDLEEWAKAQGCDGVEAIAVPKWRHLFAGYGVSHQIFVRRF